MSSPPPAQFAPGTRVCMLGRAHAEMVEYGEASGAFSRARAVDPHRLEGMEVYSTAAPSEARDEGCRTQGARKRRRWIDRRRSAWCVRRETVSACQKELLKLGAAGFERARLRPARRRAHATARRISPTSSFREGGGGAATSSSKMA